MNKARPTQTSVAFDKWRPIVERLVRDTAATRRPGGPNPLVGARLVDDDGAVLATGIHRGAGTSHAEVDAFAIATREGVDLRGRTLVVTLEPCHHHGRTPPCTDAVFAAGVRRVVFAASDPTVAGGGAALLRERGIEVVGPVDEETGRSLDARWFSAVAAGRPHVTWKAAASLDGFSADAWGRSKWVTDERLRSYGRRLRAEHDAIIVGTQTVLDDDPKLDVRGDEKAAFSQPLRVVVGLRDVPAGARVLDAAAPTMHLRTRNPAKVLSRLWGLGARRVLLEGGPTLAGAFLENGFIDELHLHLAPLLLGRGTPFAWLTATPLGEALSFTARTTRSVGDGFVLELARD